MGAKDMTANRNAHWTGSGNDAPRLGKRPTLRPPFSSRPATCLIFLGLSAPGEMRLVGGTSQR